MQNQSGQARELDPEFLLTAYCNGYFPMADPESGRISWYSPDPRTVFELGRVRISRSLRRSLRRDDLEVRWDTGFEAVIRACGERPETWISDRIVEAYMRLHRLGFAHSVEVWQHEKLVGGLYGVTVGGAFFGESMFSRVTDASKIALVHLVRRLNERGFLLLDAQFMTEHLRTLGATEIPRSEYVERLRKAVHAACALTDNPSRAEEDTDVDIP